MRRSITRLRLLVAVLAVALAVAPAALARDEAEVPPSSGGFVGVGAMLCTLVYSPLKLSYAATGAAVGGLAWVWSLGNRRVSGPIFTAALKGDYVVTPAHLRRERSLRFTGRRR
jgi:hypothetical protein